LLAAPDHRDRGHAEPYCVGRQEQSRGVRCLSRSRRTNSSNPALYRRSPGQPPLYIYYQLLQFREQRRVNEPMSPFAAKLTDADMKDIAAYFDVAKACWQRCSRPMMRDPQQAMSRRSWSEITAIPAIRRPWR